MLNAEKISYIFIVYEKTKKFIASSSYRVKGQSFNIEKPKTLRKQIIKLEIGGLYGKKIVTPKR